MSLEVQPIAPEPNMALVGSPEPTDAGDDFAAFSEKFDKLTSETERDEAGRFKAKDAEPVAEAAQEPAEKVEAEAQPEAAPKAFRPLPALAEPVADVLQGLEPEKADKLASWIDKVHRDNSALGREAAQARGFVDVARQFPQYFGEGKVNPAEGFAQLVQAQARLDADPIEGIMWLADRYGVRDLLTGGADGQPAPLNHEVLTLRQTIAELRQEISSMASPQVIERRVQDAMQASSAQDLVNRWAQAKPFYNEVEADLPYFVQRAKERTPGGKPDAILDAAYDMAINADPVLREKVRASAAKPAADAAAKRTEDAKKAASINVAQQTSGKPSQLTEEQQMEATWARLMAS